MSMTRAQHLLVEFNQCDVAILNDIEKIEILMRKSAQVANATVLNAIFQQFQPQGITGILVLAESHLSIHTWPQKAYASVDFYTCGHSLPEKACAVLQQGLHAQDCEMLMIDRGLLSDKQRMCVRYHQ